MTRAITMTIAIDQRCWVSLARIKHDTSWKPIAVIFMPILLEIGTLIHDQMEKFIVLYAMANVNLMCLNGERRTVVVLLIGCTVLRYH